MTRSMTGFAEAEGESGGRSWRWTLRSVNGKGLDLKLRLAPGYEAAEPLIRKLDTGLHRGNVTATMRWERTESDAGLRVDEQALTSVLGALQTVRKTAKAEGIKLERPRADAVAAMGGVLRAGPDAEAPGEGALRAVAESFEIAARRLVRAREEEGGALRVVLTDQVDEIERLVALAARQSEDAVPSLRDRLSEQVSALVSGELPEDRIAQEAALLAVRADIREELDRLRAHRDAARTLLADDGPVGRKLEFLAQEFAREASTLTTKAPTNELKRTGLDLRHVVDQLREQVLNVE